VPSTLPSPGFIKEGEKENFDDVDDVDNAINSGLGPDVCISCGLGSGSVVNIIISSR